MQMLLHSMRIRLCNSAGIDRTYVSWYKAIPEAEKMIR